MSNLFNSVSRFFDELAPEVISLNVPTEGVTVVALYFTTDRAPYVVTNPEGGKIQREVPWRVNNETKSATRSQLLRLLSPLQKLPEVELLDLTISCYRNHPIENLAAWSLVASLYLSQPGNQQTTFPIHKTEVSFGPSGRMYEDQAQLSAGFTVDQRASNAFWLQSGLTITGCGAFTFWADFKEPLHRELAEISNKNTFVKLALLPAGCETKITFDRELTPATKPNKEIYFGYWKA